MPRHYGLLIEEENWRTLDNFYPKHKKYWEKNLNYIIWKLSR